MAQITEIINAATISAQLGAMAVAETSTVSVQLDDVWFSKRADKELWQDGLLTYTIEIRNETDPDADPTPPDLTQITITDTIDIANMRVVGNEFIFTPAGAGTADYNDETGLLTLTLLDIGPGENVTVSFRTERVLP